MQIDSSLAGPCSWQVNGRTVLRGAGAAYCKIRVVVIHATFHATLGQLVMPDLKIVGHIEHMTWLTGRYVRILLM